MKETIEKSVEAMGVTILGYSVPVATPQEDVTGQMDILIRQPDWTPEVWEVKSINSMAFKYKDLPYPWHRGQLGFYEVFYDPDYVQRYKKHPKDVEPHEFCGAHCLLKTELYQPIASFDKWPAKGELVTGRMVYVSKDDALIESPVIARTHELEEQIYDEINELREWYDKQRNLELPPRLPLVPKRLAKDESPNYQKAGPWGAAGTPKLEYDKECHRGNGSNIKCPFFEICFAQEVDESISK